MRNFILVLFYVSTVFIANSQSQDLFNLANGTFIDFNILYNNYDPENTCYICTETDDVYGYYSLYNNGEVSENLEEIEYILLDKNLNKFANGTFKKLIAPRKASSRLRVFKKQDTLVIYNSVYSTAVFSSFNFLGVYQKLVLKDNTLLPAYYYDKKGKRKTISLDSLAKTFTKRRLKELDNENDYSKEKKDSLELHKTLFSYNDEKHKVVLNKGGEIKKKYIKNKYDKSLSFVDDEETKWDIPLLKAAKNDYIGHYPLFLDKEKDNIGMIRYHTKKNEDLSDIFIYDLKNGEQKRSFSYNTNNDYRYKDYFNLENERLTILSSVISGYYFLGFNFNKFNIENDDSRESETFRWEDASKFIEIKRNGLVENGLRLRLLNYFFLKNGDIGILTEKYKTKPNGKIITTDYVFFMFDKDFKLADASIIVKDKSKTYSSNIDYLFSQEVDGGSIIFYRDYKKDAVTKDRNWILGIITYIDGKFGHQTLPITSEDYNIIPFLAKEGYVLLAEFNAKEEKYNKIRLEKINY
ncbi:hypothetical protein [Hyunsoonleella pacifica]|uniref:WG repeat-containing protein n=1 Tax=Hyunsoonleella pacifica TaxID=1080224 RepID=A0A4Q9FLW3_9FLAO|nr:hypothetical protein [Hyunsoonleella pacifica]TBN14643.1 hypothetical protein EYD46_13820 [Hyunsoonleella pacifica]GGD15482.1 hypothetical protein GCM10011368_16800 [Hyunsoonleella pacifica]